MNKSLVFVDGEYVKVVFGTAIKCIKLSELEQPSNSAFLDKIFSQFEVHLVTSIAKIDKNKLLNALKIRSGQLASNTPEGVGSRIPPPPEETVEEDPTNPRAPKELQGMIKAHKQSMAARGSLRDVFAYGYLKSNAKSHIVIDDINTREELAPGILKQFCIPAQRTASLTGLDPDQVNKSRILRRYLDNGVLVPCSSSEAAEIEANYETARIEENDARLDNISPIVDSHEAVLSGKTGRGRSNVLPDDDEGNIDLTADLKSEETEALRAQARRQRRPPAAGMKLPHENSGDAGISDVLTDIAEASNEVEVEIEELDSSGDQVPGRVQARMAIKAQSGLPSGHGAAPVTKKHRPTTE